MTGRGVEQTACGVTVIDDSFNGNPASMVAALGSLKARPVKAGRRIAILGDMLELGTDAPAYHTKLAGDLPGIDGVYCVGPLMRHLYDLVPAERALGWHEDPATLDPREIAALLREATSWWSRAAKRCSGSTSSCRGCWPPCRQRRKLAKLPTRCFRTTIRQYPIDGQDLLGLRMKTIIKAFPERTRSRSASREDGATKPRDRAY